MNQELQKYIENEILPLYTRNDEGHNVEHVNQVIKRSMEIIEDNQLEVNKDISYTVAAYHDLGCYIDRKNHEIISAEIFMKDEKIKRWFSKEEMQIIKEAIEDHRASSKNEPRNIYGRIVTTADKGELNIDNAIFRTKQYLEAKPDYNQLSKADVLNDIYNHLVKKFGKDGYVKVCLEDKKYRQQLNEIREIINNTEELKKRIEKALD